MADMSIPNPFPLPNPFFYVFAQDGKMSFGWKQSGFYIKARERTRHSFPLTPDGWSLAWETMSSDYPKLAAKVAAAVEKSSEERAGRLELERLGSLAVVTGCAFLGGHGLTDALIAGTGCTLRFTEEGLFVHRPLDWKALIRSPYSEATALELSESSKKSSAGKVAGATLAFGVIGAAWTLTHPDVRTFIRYEAGQSLEAFFACSTATPEELRVRLSAPLSRISVQPPPSSPLAVPPLSVADELMKLAKLKADGVLTEDEFAAQKAKLLS